MSFVIEAKATFNAMKILQTVIEAEMQPLADIAEDVADVARFSIVQAPRKSAGQLSRGERKEYRRTGNLPFQSSEPGTPPHTRNGALPKSIVGAVDRSNQLQPAAVAGPTGRATFNQTLEFGGFTSLVGRRYAVKPRPFMQPALEQESGRALAMFEGMLNDA